MLVGAGRARRGQLEVEILQIVFVLTAFAGIGWTSAAADGRQRTQILIEELGGSVVHERRRESVQRVHRVAGVHRAVPERVVTLGRVVVGVPSE